MSKFVYTNYPSLQLKSIIFYMQLWQKVILGLILGIAFGVYAPEQTEYVRPIGEMFLRMVKMLIAPLIFFTITSSVINMRDTSTLGRIGSKSVIAFLSTSLFAAILGVIIAILLAPGEDTNFDIFQIKPTFQEGRIVLSDFLINFIPSNIVSAFAEDNAVQLVFCAVFIGFAVNQMSAAATPLVTLLHKFSKMILKMISIVIQLSPYGAFGLTAWAVGTQGLEVMLSSSKLIVAMLTALILQYILFGAMIYLFCRISPTPFFQKSTEYQLIGFSTASSKAALATAIETCIKKLGISENNASFILPLGVSMSMNGFAINLALTTIFFAQMLDATLMPYDYFMIILMSIIGSIGGAGIPGASLIMLPMVLSSIGLPIEGVAIIAGIDRILDMVRTTVNITGIAAITLIIDHNEGTLDESAYFYHPSKDS